MSTGRRSGRASSKVVKTHSDVPIWLMERAKPGATVGYTDIGLTGWVTDLYIIDLAGLTDGVTSGATGLDWEGRAAYLGERAPDWIVLKPNGDQRFAAIAGSQWLIENYDLEAGPRGTLAGQRKGVERATPEEILASFSRAAAREPHSRHFLWKRVQWAAAVGTKKQIAAACAALEEWADLGEGVERCRKMKPGRAAPEITREPLPASLARHLYKPAKDAKKKAAPEAAAASLNPFSRPGKHGVGAGWAPVPPDKASLARLEDGALALSAAPAGAFQVCDKKQPLTGGTVTVRGSWALEGFASAQPGQGARITLGAYGADKQPIGPPGGKQKLWTVAKLREDAGWTDITQTLELPPGVATIRLCATLAGDAGTARLRDLRAEGS